MGTGLSVITSNSFHLGWIMRGLKPMSVLPGFLLIAGPVMLVGLLLV